MTRRPLTLVYFAASRLWRVSMASLRPVDDVGSDDDDAPVVYVILGSQFSAKALLALDAHGIPHRVVFVPLSRAARRLPSDASPTVPQMTHRGAILTDSEDILHHLDDSLGASCFPARVAREASEASVRASDGVLAALVLHYNWVDEPGYRRSMRAAGVRAMPWYVPLCLSGAVVDRLARKARASFARRVRKIVAKRLFDGDDAKADATLADPAETREALVRELEWFQATLKEAPFMLGVAEAPCAADVSAFAQLERLVGTMGDASVPPSLPELASEPRLARLMAWRKEMSERCPIRFKGKRGGRGGAAR